MGKERLFSSLKSIIAFLLAPCILFNFFSMAIYAKTDDLSSTVSSVKLEESKFSYTGKEIKPKVIVKNSNNQTLVQGTDYTVRYPKSAKNIGDYKITVNYMGNYSGSKTLTFQILPQVVNNLTFEQGTGKFKEKRSPWTYYSEVIDENYAYVTKEINGVKLSWAKSAGATAYRIYIYRDKKWVKLANTSKTEYIVKNLTAGKRYSFAVRAYTAVSNKKYFSKTYTSIVAASRPEKTKIDVKVKNHKAYISWEKRTCSGYYLYVRENDAKYKKIKIPSNGKTSYVYEYPDYANTITVRVHTYVQTEKGSVLSDNTHTTRKVTPYATKTSGGIAIKPVTSKEAKKIIEDNWYTLHELDEFFEGTSADGKRIVVYHNWNGEWSGIDGRGVFYYGNGKAKRCPNCGKLAAKHDGKNMCDAIGCYIFFGYSGE